MTSYQCYVVLNLDSVHSVWYIFRLSNMQRLIGSILRPSGSVGYHLDSEFLLSETTVQDFDQECVMVGQDDNLPSTNP